MPQLPPIPPLTLFVIGVYLLAFYCIWRILLSYRSSQGALTWILALLAFPFLALIAYFLIGRPRLQGYSLARQVNDRYFSQLVGDLRRKESPVTSQSPGNAPELQAMVALTRLPFSTGNHCELLKNGQRTFESLFEAIAQAEHYILLTFYIVRHDGVGQRLREALEARLAEGVRVYFIYDDIGSALLSYRYLRALRKAGAHVVPFSWGRGWRYFELNFRNHRKLLICDGRIGFLGGINLGDEYMGPPASEWRDTHCRIEGPAVMALQLTFMEDWFWATGERPHLNWQPHYPDTVPESGDAALILPTGPADELDTGALYFLNCIQGARHRLWIASPYFVPGGTILSALQLAALRGVDVRIIIPDKPDNWLIGLAAYSYLVQADRTGIGIYRYQPGFMHQKVALVDDRYAAVGTTNLDNRSMSLNFEIMALVASPRFVQEVEIMLRDDLRHCQRLNAVDYQNRSVFFRLASRSARLLGPLL